LEQIGFELFCEKCPVSSNFRGSFTNTMIENLLGVPKIYNDKYKCSESKLYTFICYLKCVKEIFRFMKINRFRIIESDVFFVITNSPI